MSSATPATRALDAAKVAYVLRPYDYEAGAGEHKGLEAAHALGEPPARVLKTLLARVDGKPVCVVLPSDHEVSMKKLAAAFHGKSAQMMPPAEAERLSGYHVGGISPLGQRKRVPVAIEAAALAHDAVLVNGGQRGLLLQLAPRALADVLRAVLADLVA
ncbi:Cys-tRNA(Pro) deacylase [Xanthomonas massiliensis]|uniref:Cys-tRNA(Pro) deacylase n=1 Tax=Xanthomonas massiliensis TaxID=1720302 RepID=UPI000825377A|nr:Cys-tRNA(Pro) deacylase [Xanthomonas massiliensis]